EYGQPGSNGLTLDPQGRLTIDEHGRHRVTRLERDGSLSVLAEQYQGKRLNSPNDLVYRSDGTLYFTDPPFGLPKFFEDPRKELPFSGVFSWKDGRLRLLTHELQGPNGIVFSPDEKYLYVSNWDPKAKTVTRYPVKSDGTINRGADALGGFACGTVVQAKPRRYDGLLVASLQPPVQRVSMVSKVEVLVRYRNRSYELGSNEFAGGSISPRGFELLSAFEDQDGLPVWTYACGDARLEQRLWMADGRNTTYLRFQLQYASAAMDLELRPLCTYRDYHAHARGGWSLEVADEPHGCRVTAFPAARPYRVLIDGGEFQREPDWYWNFYHRAEAERGLDTTEDLFRPGTF